MVQEPSRKRPMMIVVMVLVGIAAIGGLIWWGARSGLVGPPGSRSAVDRTEFLRLAKTAECADLANNLFVIDDQSVFWVREGSCADASYSYTLYGQTKAETRCSEYVTIAGPISECRDSSAAALFDTIVTNRGASDLGLGAGHKVERLTSGG